MATGYEKILASIKKKNGNVVSEVSLLLTQRNCLVNNETTLKPQGFQATGPEVSAGSPPYSLPAESDKWIEEIIDLALNGELTEPVLLPVRPAYQDILGYSAWLCPGQASAKEKALDMAFTPEELIKALPLLKRSRVLASILIEGKRIFGGTIIDVSLMDSPSASLPECLADSVDSQVQEAAPGSGGISQEGLTQEGRHHVKIISVKGHLHNFKDYTGPRARLEMEILEGPDVGKTLLDNISLPHPHEPEGRRKRRLHIECQLGLISWGYIGKKNIDWKSLGGMTVWVDVAHREFKGRLFPMVSNYELQKN